MSAKRTNSRLRRRSPANATEATPMLSETEAVLAFAAPEAAAPSPLVKDRLLARIRAEKAVQANVVQPGWRFESVNAAEGWRAGVIPGVRFKTLSVDEQRDMVVLLMEMAPGARFPDHVHDDGPDEGIVISGDVITGGRLMRAGDYYYAAEGTKQIDTVSPSGCTALVTLTARAWKKWRLQLASR